MKRIFFLVFALFLSFSVFSSHTEEFDRLFNEELEELRDFPLYLMYHHGADNAFAVNSNAMPHAWVEPTPTQGQGPFYPVRFPSDVDTDLTILNNGPQAIGIPVYIQGQIMNQNGEIIKNAKIEIWQACASGRYNHPKDTNPAAVDPNFQYYGTILSDETGKYIFKTIVPGPYPADNNWWRPPHIHFKVSAPDYKTLTTQSYFDGDSFPEVVTRIGDQDVTGEIINNFNRADFLLASLTQQQRSRLIVSFQSRPELNDLRLGVFNIYLQGK